MKSLIQVILHLIITTLVLTIFNEGIIITFNRGTLLSGAITVGSF